MGLPDATNLGPLSIVTALVQPTSDQVADRAGALPNSFQASLAAAAHNLPVNAPASVDDLPAAPSPLAPATYPTVATAATTATARTSLFLGV